MATCIFTSPFLCAVLVFRFDLYVLVACIIWFCYIPALAVIVYLYEGVLVLQVIISTQVLIQFNWYNRYLWSWWYLKKNGKPKTGCQIQSRSAFKQFSLLHTTALLSVGRVFYWAAMRQLFRMDWLNYWLYYYCYISLLYIIVIYYWHKHMRLLVRGWQCNYAMRGWLNQTCAFSASCIFRRRVLGLGFGLVCLAGASVSSYTLATSLYRGFTSRLSVTPLATVGIAFAAVESGGRSTRNAGTDFTSYRSKVLSCEFWWRRKHQL